jgi:hypothetical protein
MPDRRSLHFAIACFFLFSIFGGKLTFLRAVKDTPLLLRCPMAIVFLTSGQILFEKFYARAFSYLLNFIVGARIEHRVIQVGSREFSAHSKNAVVGLKHLFTASPCFSPGGSFPREFLRRTLLLRLLTSGVA